MAINEDYNLNVKARGTAQARQQIAGLGKGFGAVTTAAKAFVAALAVKEIVNFGNSILEASKKFEQYYNRLRLVTNGQDELNDTFNKLKEGARAARTDLGSYIELFSKLKISTEQLGYSTEQVEKVTANLSKALQIAGADGATVASVIRQFGQAMASGEVRGDEFRSIVEGMGGALTLMSIETGISIGQLRKMSREGKLTADVLFDMFLKTESLAIMFESLDPTIESAQIAFGDAFGEMIKNLGQVTGFTATAIEMLKDYTYSMKRFNDKEGEGFKSLTDEQIVSLIQLGEKTTNYADLLRELGIRIKDEVLQSGYLNLEDNERYQLLTKLIPQVEEIIDLNKAEAQAKLEDYNAARKLNEEMNKALRPYQTFIKLGQEYIEMDFGTELEKARKKYKEATKTIQELNSAQTNVAEGGKKFGDLYEELQVQIDAATIAQREFLKEVERLEDMEHPLANFALHIKEQGDLLKQIDGVAQRTYGRMADAITDFVMTGKFSFKDLARSIIADLVRIAAQAAITFAIKTAAAAVGIPLPFLAEGGPAKRGTPYIVGEKGPELFVPNQSGTVISNDDVGQMAAQADGSVAGAPVNINFNINTIDASGFDELLISRRGLITGIINQGLNRQGKGALV